MEKPEFLKYISETEVISEQSPSKKELDDLATTLMYCMDNETTILKFIDHAYDNMEMTEEQSEALYDKVTNSREFATTVNKLVKKHFSSVMK